MVGTDRRRRDRPTDADDPPTADGTLMAAGRDRPIDGGDRPMERLTIRVPEDLKEEIDDLADAEDVSTSEAARTLLRRGTEADALRQDVARLRREKRLILEQRSEHTDLVRYAETEKAYREAGLGTRMKWWLFGREEE